MCRRLSCLVPLAFLLLPPSAFGATYYLSPGGDDDNSGTRQRPWQTLDKANASLQPGDTVILAGGRYEGVIEPGRWHEAEFDAGIVREVFPDVKLLQTFRFYTDGNGKKGQEFWFDDFRILPKGDSQ